MYPITEIFHTLQGEGHFVGYPAVFVRFAGCGVHNCAIRGQCDEAPWPTNQQLTVDDVVREVSRFVDHGIVVLTGGEPSDHDLVPVISKLRDVGYRIHVETSGVRPLTGLPIEWLTVSPKTLDYAQRSGHTLKVVVSETMTWGDVDKLDEGTAFFHRYLQPLMQLDGSSSLEHVKALLLQRRNTDGRWALSTQAHKVWNLR